jgi:hypothetical protein
VQHHAQLKRKSKKKKQKERERDRTRKCHAGGVPGRA